VLCRFHGLDTNTFCPLHIHVTEHHALGGRDRADWRTFGDEDGDVPRTTQLRTYTVREGLLDEWAEKWRDLVLVTVLVPSATVCCIGADPAITGEPPEEQAAAGRCCLSRTGREWPVTAGETSGAHE
jgi:hypothetical protein